MYLPFFADFGVSTGGLLAGAVVGVIISSIVVVLLILFVLWWRGYLGGKEVEDEELRALDLQTGFFTLRQIKDATNNFDNANKIGEGGFGSVYKGTLSDGTIIAVKQLFRERDLVYATRCIIEHTLGPQARPYMSHVLQKLEGDRVDSGQLMILGFDVGSQSGRM